LSAIGCRLCGPSLAELPFDAQRLRLGRAHAFLGIQRRELEHTHVLERGLDARPQRPMSFSVGTMRMKGRDCARCRARLKMPLRRGESVVSC
jgi:hypothetical protein